MKAPGKLAPKQPSADTGLVLPCMGNHFVSGHPLMYLAVMESPRCRHARCPIASCRTQYLFNGVGWRNVGVTREEALRLSPNAIFG